VSPTLPRLLSAGLLLVALAGSHAADDPQVPVPPASTPPATTPPVAKPAPAKPAAKPAPARAAPPALLPLPAPDAIEAAQKGVRESFKDDYAHARKPEDRLPLARKLLDQALTMVGADVERLGMLREACELAARAGETALALEAIDEQAARFAFSQGEERLRVLMLAVVKPASVESALAAGDALCGLADDGIADDNYLFAQRAAKEADTLARRLKDPQFAARSKLLLERAKLLGDDYDKLGEITDLLGNTPPDAHQRYGRFLCFQKGDWSRGLAHLAEGDDPALKAIAQAEIAAGAEEAESDAPLKVADGWYDFGQKQRAALKEEIHAHALAWYRRAGTTAQGLAKVRLDKRIEELERALGGGGRRVRYPGGATLLLTFERETLAAQGSRLTQVLDASGHNLRAVATGPLAVESGAHGTALKCDGKSWLSIANCKELQITGSQTIAFWLRPEALGLRRNPFNKNYSGEGTMTLEPDGTLNYFYGIEGDYMAIALAGAGVLKKWTHVAIVRDLAVRRLTWFKDGKKENERAAAYAAAVATNGDLLIGTGYTSNPYIGQLDDVGVWPRVLTEAEIRQLYEATAAGR
jgi:hypothetical protein